MRQSWQTYHVNDELLRPFGIHRLLLCLRLEDTLAIKSEDSKWIGFATAVGCMYVAALNEIDAKQSHVYVSLVHTH